MVVRDVYVAVYDWSGFLLGHEVWTITASAQDEAVREARGRANRLSTSASGRKYVCQLFGDAGSFDHLMKEPKR